MTEKRMPKIIDFGEVSTDDEVNIKFFEVEDIIPFQVKRVYSISSSGEPSIRGRHAHMNQEQVIVCLKGNAELCITDTNNKTHNFNNLKKKAVYIPEGFWIEVRLEPHSLILCFASKKYSDLTTIFDKELFLSIPK